jgi:hypothetical protein
LFGLTLIDTRADVHGCPLSTSRKLTLLRFDIALGGSLGGSSSLALGSSRSCRNDSLRDDRGLSLGTTFALSLSSSTGTRSSNLVVVDNDADTRTAFTCAELNLGTLHESGLGIGEGTVEASEVTLGNWGGLRRDDINLARFDRALPTAEDVDDVLGL